MFKFLRRTSLYLLAAPILCIALGAASNQLVLVTNHDRFPVSINLVKLQKMTNSPDGDSKFPIELSDGTVMIDDVHCLMTNKTHLNWLADEFDFKDAIYSVGDGLIVFGGWSWGYAPFIWLFAAVSKLSRTE